MATVRLRLQKISSAQFPSLDSPTANYVTRLKFRISSALSTDAASMAIATLDQDSRGASQVALHAKILCATRERG